MNNWWFLNLKLRNLLSGTSPFRRLVLGAALLSCIPGAKGGVPEWLRAAAQTSLPKYPDDTNAVMLLDEQVTSISASGEIKTRYRHAFKILRPEGRERGFVAVHFDKETRLTYLKAWSLPADGKDYEVKEKEAVETSPFGESLYQDTRLKFLRIPAAEPGNVIGYEYEQRRRPQILQDTWWFQDDIPVRRARFELQLPKGWEFKPFWLNHSVVNPQPAGESQWVWELENVPALETEPAMPSRRALEGRLGVTYYPRDTEGRGGTGKSQGTWQHIGLWYAQLAADRRRATPEIHQKVTELTSGASTMHDKIQALATFVQKDIRYVAIEIGIGGYQPHAAEDVFKDRYGDCKDKVTLLSTMLQVIGVESYYVLINTSRGVVSPEFPTALTFNPAILAIRLPADVATANLNAVGDSKGLGRLLFFDPTDPLTPLGYLPPWLQANYGLLVAQDGSELERLPLAPPTLNRLLRVATLTLTPTGSLYGDVQEVRWGAPAATLRAELLKAQTPDERRKVLESFLGKFLGGSLLMGTAVENLEKFDSILVLHYRFGAENYAKTAGDMLLVRPRVLGEKKTEVMEGKERKQAVEFFATTLESDIFEITLPGGYKVDELPPTTDASCGFAQYKSQVAVAGNVLRYQRIYTINDVLVPTERLDELKKFYRRVSSDERAMAVLKRAGP